MTREKAQALYIEWLRVNHPPIYSTAREATRVQGLGIFAAIGAAIGAAGDYLLKRKQKKEAKKLLKKQQREENRQRAQLAADEAARLQLLALNTQRAQAGQPPVNAAGQVLASPRAIAASASSDYLPWIVGALLLAIGIKKLKR